MYDCIIIILFKQNSKNRQNMQYSHKNKIIVDEYDRLMSDSKKRRVYQINKEQHIRCEYCEQQFPAHLMNSHKNICQISDKKQQYYIIQKDKYQDSQNKQKPNQDRKCLKKIKNTHIKQYLPNSMRNFKNNNKINAQKIDKKTVYQQQTFHPSNRPISSNSRYSSRRGEHSSSKYKNKNKGRQIPSQMFLSNKFTKNGSLQKKLKSRQSIDKKGFNKLCDSAMLRQSIESKLMRGKGIKNDRVKKEQNSKIKKKTMNKSMVSQGYQEYYDHNSGNLHKTGSLAKNKQKKINKRNEKKSEIKRVTNRRQKQIKQPEYYFDDQRAKIKKIQKQRQRLQQQKQKLLEELEKQRQWKKRKEQEKRIQQIQQNRARQRQRQRQARGQAQNRQRNRRNRQNSRNRPNRSRQQQRRAQMYSQQSYYQSDNNDHSQAFSFITNTMNQQFQIMKQQFSQMNQIFSNFVPFSSNTFVFCGNESDSYDSYSEVQSQNIQFDQSQEGQQEQGLTPQQIDSLNKFNYCKRLGVQDQCTVCLNNIKHNQVIKQLPCAHMFHIDCIDEWLQKKTSCPVCREDILNSLV